MLDVKCQVDVVLGTARITVRDCLALAPRSIVRLQEAAGADARVLVSNVPLAGAEVVVAEDRSAVRLTEILKPALSEAP
jgi:flagellar motor switch protein FliN